MRVVRLFAALGLLAGGQGACRETSGPTESHRASAEEPRPAAGGARGQGGDATSPGGATGPAQPSEHEHEELPKSVQLSPQVLRDAHVTTVTSARRALAATVELNGQVAPDPDHIAMIGARVEARVTKVLVREGDSITAGQAVAVLTSAELARRRAEYAAATARAATSRRNADRQRALVQQRLGSEQEAASAASEATAGEAERDALAQMIRGMGAAPGGRGDPAVITLSSPIAGQVVARDSVPGQLVSPDHTLITVADLSRAYFEAQLFEKDLAQVHEGADAEVRLNGYPDQVLSARVARVSSQIDARARTLTARLHFDGVERRALRLGLFGIARITLARDTGPAQIVVPLGAVVDLGERKVVFVKRGDGAFQLHPVTVGASTGGFSAILSGLDAGEDVAVGGVHALKSAALKSTTAEDD
jgi:cobalt-zinc-cadmium efflux system membrane fusion protein